MNIEIVEKADHLELIEVWEASVRATHDFLTEDDLQELKPLILEQYFDAVDLRCIKNARGEIQGFCGVHDGNIEMLVTLLMLVGKVLVLYCQLMLSRSRAHQRLM